ncbi:hypothetical protein EU245_12310 [Lentibacillus lipolyticus]|nr:hypothetical protein EU245_12310 [Lentibacillus lipolyticus]
MRQFFPTFLSELKDAGASKLNFGGKTVDLDDISYPALVTGVNKATDSQLNANSKLSDLANAGDFEVTVTTTAQDAEETYTVSFTVSQ